MTTHEILVRARAACDFAAELRPAQIDRALHAMANRLVESTPAILAANRADMDAARGKLSEVMLDRLALSEARIEAMAEGIRAVAALPCPCGATLSSHRLPNGLRVRKVAVPLGVVAIIYESRPNVTSDAAVLCLKSGNVCVLRSGRDAFASANAVTEALRAGLADAGLEPDLVQLVQDPSRASANELMTAVGYVDLLIPRGGGGLIRACTENATVPCIQTGMHLRGPQRRPGHGPAHHRERENQPSLRVQRRRGPAGASGDCRRIPAEAENHAGGRAHRRREAPGGAAAGRGLREAHRRDSRGRDGFRHGVPRLHPGCQGCGRRG